MIYVFFRGRNTESVISDAIAEDIIPEDTEVIILASKNDKFRLETDIDVDSFQINDSIILVANGGTTKPQVKTVLKIARSGFPFQIWDVQMEGASLIEESPGFGS